MFNTNRFAKSKEYFNHMVEIILERFPSTRVDCIKQMDVDKGTDESVLTVNDYFKKIDLTVDTEDTDRYNFQFKTSSSSHIFIPVIRIPKQKNINGSYLNSDGYCYIPDLGSADTWLFYLPNSNQAYCFKSDVIRQMFRYSEPWNQGIIKFTNNNGYTIRFLASQFCDLYLKYFTFMTKGLPTTPPKKEESIN